MLSQTKQVGANSKYLVFTVLAMIFFVIDFCVWYSQYYSDPMLTLPSRKLWLDKTRTFLYTCERVWKKEFKQKSKGEFNIGYKKKIFKILDTLRRLKKNSKNSLVFCLLIVWYYLQKEVSKRKNKSFLEVKSNVCTT